MTEFVDKLFESFDQNLYSLGIFIDLPKTLKQRIKILSQPDYPRSSFDNITLKLENYIGFALMKL